MDTSQNLANDKNSSLQLLHAYDSSDSCDENDESQNSPGTVSKNNLANTSLSNAETKNKKTFSKFNISASSTANDIDNTEWNDFRSIADNFVLKNNAKNANEHGPMDVEVPSRDSVETAAETPVKNNNREFINFESETPREATWNQEDSASADGSQDSDSESSSEWESLKGAEESTDSDEANSNAKGATFCNKKIAPKVKGELGLDDLPPIQDLVISVPNTECLPIGTIYDIVDQLVIVKASPNKPTLDLDTLLFLEEGSRTLGHIFDVFGQVTEPFYCVRFNSKDHIKNKGVERGMSVYCAPKSQYTHLVFVTDLMKLKGSDASWKDDVEPPSQFLEFSDDEEERKAKHALKEKKKASTAASGNGESSSANKRHKPTAYEERMNRKNLEKTAEFNMRNQTMTFAGFGRGFPGGRGLALWNHGNQGNPMEIQWTPNNSYFVGANPFEPPPQRPWGMGQFEVPRVPQRSPRPMFLARTRVSSFPPPGFARRPPPPPPGFPPL